MVVCFWMIQTTAIRKSIAERKQNCNLNQLRRVSISELRSQWFESLRFPIAWGLDFKSLGIWAAKGWMSTSSEAGKCFHNSSQALYNSRNTPSTAGNSMTGSERPSPEPILKKEASPAVLGGREFWKRSGSLKCLEF